jgi:hypothetical protein
LLRKIVLNIHIYGGLLCFSYLILLGISTLNFGHPFAFTAGGTTTTWTQPLTVPQLARTEGKNTQELSRLRTQNNQMILHALGSFAFPNTAGDGNWKDANTWHAHFARVGKEYDIDVHVDGGTATVTQTRKNIWTLIRELHGEHGTYAESIFASTWAWYTDLCACVVVAAGISGVYLWTRRRRERAIGLILLAAATAVSASLMLVIALHG